MQRQGGTVRLRVKAALIRRCRAGKEYTTVVQLARELKCDKWTVREAIKESKELQRWQAQALRARGYPGRKADWPRVQAGLLGLCEKGEPYTGLADLARRMGSSSPTVSKAIKESEELRAWQARAWEERRPVWPGVQAKLLDRARKGKLYTTRARLAQELGCPEWAVSRAIRKSPELRAWRARGWRARGWRAPSRSRPGSDWLRVQAELLRRCRGHVPYTTVASLAQEIGCSRGTVRKAIMESEELQRWQARGLRTRGWKRRRAEWRDVQRILLDRVKMGEPYTTRAALAKGIGCSEWMVSRAIRESKELQRWRVRGQKRPRSDWRAVQRILLDRARKGTPYTTRARLEQEIGCSEHAARKAIRESKELQRWQRRGWRARGWRARELVWPGIRARLLKLTRKGKPYTSLPRLTREMGCSQMAVRKSIKESKELQRWQARGWRAQGQRRPKNDWRSVRRQLLALCQAGHQYTSRDDLAGQLGCSRGPIVRALKESPQLQIWRKEGLRARGWAGRKPLWPAVQAKLPRLCEQDNPYRGLVRLGRKLGYSPGTVRKAIEESADLQAWQARGWRAREGKSEETHSGPTRHGRAARPEKRAASAADNASAAEGCAGREAQRPPAGEAHEAEASRANLSKEARAIAALKDHLDWPDTEIAKAAGCSRTSLYRMPDFRKAREILKRGKADLPRGSKNADDGKVEAWDREDA